MCSQQKEKLECCEFYSHWPFYTHWFIHIGAVSHCWAKTTIQSEKFYTILLSALNKFARKIKLIHENFVLDKGNSVLRCLFLDMHNVHCTCIIITDHSVCFGTTALALALVMVNQSFFKGSGSESANSIAQIKTNAYLQVLWWRWNCACGNSNAVRLSVARIAMKKKNDLKIHRKHCGKWCRAENTVQCTTRFLVEWKRQKKKKKLYVNSCTEKGVRKHEHFGAIICISHVPKWKVPKIMDSRAAYEANFAKLP